MRIGLSRQGDAMGKRPTAASPDIASAMTAMVLAVMMTVMAVLRPNLNA